MEATAEVQNALLRIQTEYVEMPDLKLTARQAQRLWSLSHDVWETALAVLLGKQVLVETRDGAYVRHSARRTTVEASQSLLLGEQILQKCGAFRTRHGFHNHMWRPPAGG